MSFSYLWSQTEDHSQAGYQAFVGSRIKTYDELFNIAYHLDPMLKSSFSYIGKDYKGDNVNISSILLSETSMYNITGPEGRYGAYLDTLNFTFDDVFYTYSCNLKLKGIEILTDIHDNVWIEQGDYVEAISTNEVHSATTNAYKNNTPNISFNLEVSYYIFANEDDLDEYLQTGDHSKAINEPVAPEDVKPGDNSYYYRMPLYKNGELIKNINFTVNTSDKVAGYNNGNIPYNASFKISTGHQDPIDAYFYDGTETHHYTTWNDLNAAIDGEFSWLQNGAKSGSDLYKTKVQTNIPMWQSEKDAQDNADNKINDDESDNGGQPTRPPETGDDIEETDTFDIEGRVGFTKTFDIAYGRLERLGSKLWNPDNKDDLLAGLFMTENPIDVIISCFYYPINLSAFCTEGAEEPIMLGTFDTDVNARPITGVKVSNIASLYIDPYYGDFRDYTLVTTTLYLPYLGMVPIDFKAIVGKNLSIDVSVDVTTGTLKYYIKINGGIFETFGCNFGASIPITGADNMSKQREMVQDTFNMANSAVSTALNPTSGITGLVEGGIKSAADFSKMPATLISGSNSPSSSCCDHSKPYLIYDIQEAEVPVNLYQKFGVPCNKVQQLNTCSGWTECSDILLTGQMLDEEKDLIRSALRNGVII